MDSLDQALPGPSEAELGQTLQQLRHALGLEIDELAGRTGLSSEAIEALELGAHGADVATLDILARGLGIRMGVLFALCERQFLPREFKSGED